MTDQIVKTELETAEAAESRKQAQADVSVPDPETEEEAERLLGSNVVPSLAADHSDPKGLERINDGV